jgi:hypothetical protein
MVQNIVVRYPTAQNSVGETNEQIHTPFVPPCRRGTVESLVEIFTEQEETYLKKNDQTIERKRPADA